MKKIVFILCIFTNVIFAAEYREGICSDANNKSQEDRVIITPLNHQTMFLAVYDGHGGQETSQFLRDNLHKNLLNFLNNSTSAQEGFLKAFKYAEALVEKHLLGKKYCYKNYFMDGSTAVVACIKNTENEKKLQVAYVGDSRLILEEGGKVAYATTDHDFKDPAELERVLQARGVLFEYVRVREGETISRANEWRIAGLNMSRSLGDLFAKGNLDSSLTLKKKLDKDGSEICFQVYGESKPREEFVMSPSPGQVIAEPTFSEHLLTEKNRWLILVSDGFSDFVTNEEAVKFVIKCNNLGRSLEETAKFLVRTAIKKGSEDNVTAIVYDLWKS